MPATAGSTACLAEAAWFSGTEARDRRGLPQPVVPSRADSGGPGSFDEVVLPHLEAARRLARWLMGNEHDAQDAVQEASLRALRYFHTFAGGDSRAWFLRIVRNTCSGCRGRRVESLADPFDEEQHHSARPPADPETLLLRADGASLIARAMRSLPHDAHHLLVLRELQGLSYQELAQVFGIPMGTVMSRLSRARSALRGAVDSELRPPRRSARRHLREEEANTVLA